MDHIHGFKTLSKKSQRYTSFLLILSVYSYRKNEVWGINPSHFCWRANQLWLI